MPPKVAPQNVRKQRYLIVAGECWLPVKVLASPGGTDVDVDAEILNEPVVRTGPISGVVFGQENGPRITYSASGGVTTFQGGGGGPASVQVTAIIMFPADEVT